MAAGLSTSDWYHPKSIAKQKRALTLVELLVVIAIIGVLIGLALPAVQMARESSRRSACSSNLRQVATAVLLHEEAHRTLPTGGWGADWVGDPDAGFTPKQPGGWVYNILPFVEQQNLRNIGKSEQPDVKRVSLAKVLETPLEVFQCPSRRLPRPFPYQGPAKLENVNPPDKVAKSDYAITPVVSSLKSEVLLSHIINRKGASNTVMAGEKALGMDDYTTGAAAGDQLSMYCGDSDDIRRSMSASTSSDQSGSSSGFGSPHAGGCNFAFCDSAVRFISSDENAE